MGDPPSARTPLETALATDAKLRGAILKMARKWAHSDAEAEDFAQEALTKAIVHSRETGKPPPPPSFRTFLLFVGGFVRKFGFNTRRRDERHPHEELDTSAARPTAGVTHGADKVLRDHHEERRVQRLEKELREVLAAEDEKSRRIALTMLDLCDKDGTHETDDFVAAMGCSPEDVHNARKCLAYHGGRVWQRVLAEEGAHP